MYIPKISKNFKEMKITMLQLSKLFDIKYLVKLFRSHEMQNAKTYRATWSCTDHTRSRNVINVAQIEMNVIMIIHTLRYDHTFSDSLVLQFISELYEGIFQRVSISRSQDVGNDPKKNDDTWRSETYCSQSRKQFFYLISNFFEIIDFKIKSTN